MSKSHQALKADSEGFPDLKPGDRLSVYVGDQRGGRHENRQRRVGEGAYMGALRFGQRLFAILFQRGEKLPDFRGSAGLRTVQM